MGMTSKERTEKFAAAYEAVISDGGFLKLLKLRATSGIGRFSLNNIINIMFQSMQKKEDVPNILKTKNGWEEVGRKIDTWAPYWVLAPTFKAIKNDKTGKMEQRLIGFHWIKEHSLEHTSGEPLPEPPKDVDTDNFTDMFVRLEEWCIHEHGVPIEWSDKTGFASGWYSPTENSITLKEGMAPDLALCVLIHEVIHSLGADYKEMPRNECEMVVEAATAIVCMGIGLDEHIQSSIHYVSSWAGLDPASAVKLLDIAEKWVKKMETVTGSVLRAAA